MHAEHYAAWAAAVGPELMGPDELAWRARFHDSLDNFRAAFTWATEELGDDGEGLAVRMVAALADQGAHDLPSGVGTWAERIAEPARAAAPGPRTAVLGAAAFSALHRGAFDLLDGYVEDALRDDIPPDCPAPSPALMARCLRPAASLADLDLITTAGERLELIGAADHNRTHMFATEGLLAYDEGVRNVPPWRPSRHSSAPPGRNPTGLVVSLTVWAVSLGEEKPGPALAAAQESIALTHAGASDGVYSLAVGVASRLLAPTDREAALRQIAVNFDYFRDSGSFLAAYAAVVGTSDVMRQIDQPEVAAVLFGSKAGILALVPERFWSYVDWVDATRSQLGDERYTAAAARGAAMGLDDLLAYASGEIERVLSEGS